MNNKMFLVVMIFILQCANKHKEPAYSFQFENKYNLPSEIINDFKSDNFSYCVNSYIKNDLSKEAIDSIRKQVSIGIPYKRFGLRDIPLCSLTCGKPAEYYYDTGSYRWTVPVLIDSSTIVEMIYIYNILTLYQKKHLDKKRIEKDSTWIWIEAGVDCKPYCVLKTCYNIFHQMPVFIRYSPYGGELFTIPGHENEIFGQIFNTDKIEESRLKCIKPENPCEVLSAVKAILEKDNNYNKPHQAIVPLPKALLKYKTEIYKSK